jgi:hypothetical protein
MISVSIDGEDWIVDGQVTHRGRSFRDCRIEGLLLNSRMANGIFDDANPLTRDLWSYPDTGQWDPERNTDELIAMLPTYRSFGLDAICVNLQGASPVGYYVSDEAGVSELVRHVRQRHSRADVESIWVGVDGVTSQPWASGAFTPEGAMRAGFLARAQRLIRAAADSGLVVVLGLFYFGQDERLRDEQAVRRAVTGACEWILEHGLTNVVVEINNECDVPRYEHPILTPRRVHELIELARSVSDGTRRPLVGTSFARYELPSEAVVAASDFILLHGNGIDDPRDIAARVDDARAVASYRGQPVLYNEDDHFDFERPENHFLAALSRHCGWGYFDPGPGAGGTAAYGDYEVGYQNPPINWALSTSRKRSFFELLGEVTGERVADASQ